MDELIPALLVVVFGLLEVRYAWSKFATDALSGTTRVLVSVLPFVFLSLIYVAFQSAETIISRDTAIDGQLVFNAAALVAAFVALITLGGMIRDWRQAIREASDLSGTIKTIADQQESIIERVAELERFRSELDSRLGNRRRLGGDDAG